MNSFLVIGSGILTFLFCMAVSNLFYSPMDLRATSPGGRFVTNLLVSGFLAWFAAIIVENQLKPKTSPTPIMSVVNTPPAQASPVMPASADDRATPPADLASAPESPVQATAAATVSNEDNRTSELNAAAPSSGAVVSPAPAENSPTTNSEK